MSLSSPSLTHWSQLAHRLAGEVARLCARGAASRRFELHRLLRALEGEPGPPRRARRRRRSEEHTSELQSRGHLVCRLLLEKKKTAREHRCRGYQHSVRN